MLSYRECISAENPGKGERDGWGRGKDDGRVDAGRGWEDGNAGKPPRAGLNFPVGRKPIGAER